LVLHARGSFGDFGDIRCLFHIEPLGSVYDAQVQMTQNMFTLIYTTGYRYNNLILFIETEHVAMVGGRIYSKLLLFIVCLPGYKESHEDMLPLKVKVADICPSLVMMDHIGQCNRWNSNREIGDCHWWGSGKQLMLTEYIDWFDLL